MGFTALAGATQAPRPPGPPAHAATADEPPLLTHYLPSRAHSLSRLPVHHPSWPDACVPFKCQRMTATNSHVNFQLPTLLF